MLYHAFHCFYKRSPLLFLSLNSQCRSFVFPSLLRCRLLFLFKISGWCSFSARYGHRAKHVRSIADHCGFSFFLLLQNEWWIWTVFFFFDRRHHVTHSLLKFRSISIIRMIVTIYKLLYRCIIEFGFFFSEYLLSDMEVVLDRCLERNELILEDFIAESDARFLLVIKFLQRFDVLCNPE